MYWMMQPLFSHREWKGETTISYAASHHEFGLFSRERDRQFFSFKLWIERETTKKLSTVYIDCIVTLMYEYVKVILFSCDTGCLTSSCWERERDVISFSGTDREFSDERYWCQFCQFCQFFPCSSCWERRWFFLFSILVFSINSLCVSSLSSRRFYSIERRLNADTFTFHRKEESHSPRITLVWRQTWRGSLNKKENNKNNNSTKSL